MNATAARPFDVYHFFQFGGAANITSTSQIGQGGGAPGLMSPGGTTSFNGSTNYSGVMYQCAIGIGGTGGSSLSVNNGNPWKGTQNVNGSDTKSQTSVWGAPSGGGTGVMIFPRSNDSSNGTYRTVTQLGVQASWHTTGQQRHGIVADDDSFVFFIDTSDNSNYSMLFSGIYNPRPNIAYAITYPFCVVSTGAPNLPLDFLLENVYGDASGASNNQGGICGVLTGSVASCQLDHWVGNFVIDSNYNPDHQLAALGTVYNEWPIMCGIFEQFPIQQSGYLGQISFIREAFNIPVNDTTANFSRIFLGTTTAAQSKISAPWDSQNNTVPRSGNTLGGVTFVTNLDGA
jgi:hypothetical protein